MGTNDLFGQAPNDDGTDALLSGNMDMAGANPGGSSHRTAVAGSGVRKYKLLYNAHTASRAAGLPCYYVVSNTSYPGLAVTQATTGNLQEFAGIHAETVTSGAWGWVQVEGYYPSAITRLYGSGSTVNQVAGSWMGLGLNGIDELTTSAAATCLPDVNIVGQTGGYCLTMVSQASHSDVSSTTTTQAVLVFGMVR